MSLELQDLPHDHIVPVVCSLRSAAAIGALEQASKFWRTYTRMNEAWQAACEETFSEQICQNLLTNGRV